MAPQNLPCRHGTFQGADEVSMGPWGAFLGSFKLPPEALGNAKAILKTRFFLGLYPIPSEDSVELTTLSEIASALLLFIYFRESTFFDKISGFLGTPNDGRADEAIAEFFSRRLVQKENFPWLQEDWYKVTVQGRAVCDFWLSGKSGAEWPFGALLLANRRHLHQTQASPITSLDIRELGSTQLEHLAFEYASRELKLQHPRHVGDLTMVDLTFWPKGAPKMAFSEPFCNQSRRRRILSHSPR